MKVSMPIWHQIPCHGAIKSTLKAIVQKLKEITGSRPAIIGRLLEEGNYKRKAPSWIKGGRRRRRKRVSAPGGDDDAVVLSYGHHTVGRCGSVVAQKGTFLGSSDDVWLFGAFDRRGAAGDDDGVAMFLRSHLFEGENLRSTTHPPPHDDDQKPLSEKQSARRAILQTMKSAYCAAAPTSTTSTQAQESGGFACALLVNGDRLVTADHGGYRAVLCRAGKATQLGDHSRRRRKTADLIRRRCLNVMSAGKLFGHSTAVHEDENKKESPVIDAGRLGSKTDFIILASSGVWEVLGNEEAVSLVRHVDDPQEAAQRLAEEAVARMTKSTVVCQIIRINRPTIL